MQSPCIGLCTLDENNICLGCRRTIDEIMDWPNLTDEEKLAILERIHNMSLEERLKTLDNELERISIYRTLDGDIKSVLQVWGGSVGEGLHAEGRGKTISESLNNMISDLDKDPTHEINRNDHPDWVEIKTVYNTIKQEYDSDPTLNKPSLPEWLIIRLKWARKS